MLPSRRKLPPLLASLLMTLLQACAIPGTGLTEAKKTAEAIGHVSPSKADTCETQRQIAAQSSKIDTIVTGKETVYKADCKPPSPAVVASNAKPG